MRLTPSNYIINREGYLYLLNETKKAHFIFNMKNTQDKKEFEYFIKCKGNYNRKRSIAFLDI